MKPIAVISHKDIPCAKSSAHDRGMQELVHWLRLQIVLGKIWEISNERIVHLS